MTSRYFCSILLILALSAPLSTTAEAQTGSDRFVSEGTVFAGIVGAAAAVVIVAYLVIHQSVKKRSITGCVNSAENGMTVTDDKDKRLYALSGNTTGIKPGERMTLQGKKTHPKHAKTLLWKTKSITKDLGVCQP